MKKSIIKSVSVLLSVVLLLSVLPMAALAAEDAHSHVFAVTDGGYGYEPYSNAYHAYVHYTNYDCACGEDSYQTYVIESTLPHTAAPGSKVYLGSYMGSDGTLISSYQYTCIACGDTYVVNG